MAPFDRRGKAWTQAASTVLALAISAPPAGGASVALAQTPSGGAQQPWGESA